MVSLICFYLIIGLEKLEIKVTDCAQFEIDLQQYVKEPRWIPGNIKKYSLKQFIGFNSGSLLYGDSGSGKNSL